MDLILRPLADCPDELPTCALWLNREWGARHGYSYQETRDWLDEIARDTGNERGLVAMLGADPVGVGLLVDCDLDSRADLTPWLSGLFVPEPLRGRSIGRRLVAGIEGLARGQGHPALYLYTPTATGLYLKLGWRTLEKFQRRGKDYDLMSKAL